MLPFALENNSSIYQNRLRGSHLLAMAIVFLQGKSRYWVSTVTLRFNCIVRKDPEGLFLLLPSMLFELLWGRKRRGQ
jgi:hypothetical protein